jgi:hypothetical protein
VDSGRAGPKILRDVFGAPGARLPDRIDDVEHMAGKKVPAGKVRLLRDIKPEDQVMPAIDTSGVAAVAPTFDD